MYLADFWAANSISTVTKANLMKGYSDGTFRPNQPMTREEVAALFNNITMMGTAAFPYLANLKILHLTVGLLLPSSP